MSGDPRVRPQNLEANNVYLERLRTNHPIIILHRASQSLHVRSATTIICAAPWKSVFPHCHVSTTEYFSERDKPTEREAFILKLKEKKHGF